MGEFFSIVGRRYGLGPNGPLFNGRPVGDAVVGRGNYWYVDSAVDRGGGKTPSEALGTIAELFADSRVKAFDTIVVLPGHSETLSGAAGIAHNVANVTVIGIGDGPQRPVINFGTSTAASIAVSAANASWKNMRLLSTFADVVTAFDVTAAGFTMIGCEGGDSAVDLNLKSMVKCTSTTDGNANGIILIGNQFLSQDAATLGFVIFSADVLKAIIEDNIIVSEGTGLATIFTCLTGKDIRMCSVRRNVLSNKSTAGNLAYSNDTASPNNSGIIADNRIRHADVTGQMTLGVVGGCGMFNNLTSSVDSLSGFVIPAIDVDL